MSQQHFDTEMYGTHLTDISFCGRDDIAFLRLSERPEQIALICDIKRAKIHHYYL